MSAVYEVYEQDYQENIGNAETAIAILGPATTLDGPTRKKLAELDEFLDACRDALRLMGNDSAGNPDLKARITGYKKDVQRYASEATKHRSRLNRAALVDGGNKGDIEMTDQKTRLAQQTGRMDQQSAKIEEALSIAAATEHTGTDTLRNLRLQGEQMRGTTEALDDTNREVTAARAMVSSLQRRVIQHKMMMYGIIILLVFMILTIVYVNLS